MTAESEPSHPSGSGWLMARLNRGSLGPYPALVLLGSIPLLFLAVFSYVVSAQAVQSLVHRGNDAAALFTGALVEREFGHWLATLTSHAGFPTLSAAVAEGDAEEVRRRLEIFVSAHARLDRAFVTDTTGLLWVDFPVAPESLNRRFDDRDWFRGVAGSRAPYVSEVYRRNAEPQIQVVAVAAPVHSPSSGDLVGFLVAQVRLDGLSDLLGRVEVGEGGFVLLRDHAGTLAAHPTLDLPRRRYDEYADVPLPSTSASTAIARGRYDDPFTGEGVIASSLQARVGNHDWTVIAQQPADVAFAAIRTLALRLGAAGLVTAILMGGLLWGVARENARRRKAEADLVAVNEELERRVEERTAALREKEEELLQAGKIEAVGRLAGGVAHDFNNLLTVILGATDLHLTHLPEDAPERREIEDVRQAAERAADLTRQLLAFSRKQMMQPRILDVNESVDRIRGILERVLGEDIDISWRLGSDLHPVKFDPGQIEQVIMNLAVNARDAMPEGGKLTIETRNVELDEDYADAHEDVRPGPHVMLAVTDTGKGMEPETRRSVFEPFYTTKELGQGTGLGLSTVYGIIRQGGGAIRVYSEPGLGTVFRIYLPRTDEVPEARKEPEPPRAAAGTGTILVVEDEDAVRSLLVRVLGEAGYDVLEAADAQAARRIFRDREGGVDLVLTDVILPGASGPELVDDLETLDGRPTVLYMSGYTDSALDHHGVLRKGAAFIEKPLRVRTLLEKVGEALAGAGPGRP